MKPLTVQLVPIAPCSFPHGFLRREKIHLFIATLQVLESYDKIPP